jgi:hypothetical protein
LTPTRFSLPVDVQQNFNLQRIAMKTPHPKSSKVKPPGDSVPFGRLLQSGEGHMVDERVERELEAVPCAEVKSYSRFMADGELVTAPTLECCRKMIWDDAID